MEANEIIFKIFTRFTDIINGLKSLGNVYTNVKMVRKILKCLPRSWGPKVIAIEEAKDRTKMSFDELLGSLMTHKITLKSNEKNDESKLKKEITFKILSSQINEEIKDDKDSDEVIALFSRRFNKVFKKGQFPRRQGRRNCDEEKESKKDPIMYFECKKSGHIKIDCPKLRKGSRKYKKNSKKKFEKFKKAFVTWGEIDIDTSNGESNDQEVANLCLIVKEEEVNEVHCETNIFDELQDVFDELYKESLKMTTINYMLRK